MIIDFRLRPPVKPYLSGRMYNLERNKRLSESMGMYQSPSVLNYSMDMLLDEMDEAGVSIGVVPGRESNPGMGDATCEEVTSIVQSHPGRFVGIAGVDPTKPDEAFSRIEQFVVNGILKAVCLEPGALPEPLYGDDRILYPVIAGCELHQSCADRSCGGGLSFRALHHFPRRLALGAGSAACGLPPPEYLYLARHVPVQYARLAGLCDRL